jgi:beta-N-acetylhexosaminidase
MMNRALHPGRLVMVDIAGKRLDDEQARFLAEHRIRAVCLFRWNLGSEDEVRQLTADLRAVMGPQALIGIDQEGGSVVRATFLPQAPSAMALGAANDEALAESVGAAIARGLKSLGINWNFAPVVDVNNNPANPVIAERSFGADPHAVARLAGAWMRGALGEGVACCIKHFPGHGDTHVDSHRGLPVVDKSAVELEALELAPFRALRGEAPAMMTAHIVYPQIDPAHPATLSGQMLGRLLREDLGYDGVVITDSLLMKAIHDGYGYERAAPLALQAGADMVLAHGSREDQFAAVRALERALADGSLTPAQIERANTRLDALAGHYPSRAGDYPAEQRAEDDALMRRAWARGLTALRGAQPPSLHRPLRVFTQAEVPSDGVSEAGLPAQSVATLFESFSEVEFVRLPRLSELDWNQTPHDRRASIVVSNIHDRYSEAARAWRPDLHLVLWNPFQVLDVQGPTVVTWGYADGALRALQSWLEGRADAPGVAPVPLD